MDYDLIVIGTGSVGAAAGYYAARSGKKVLMLDQHLPPHTHGSHHGETRIIRHAYGEGERYVPMALRAQALWLALEKECGERLFSPCGVLNLAPSGSEFIDNVQSSVKNFQLDADILSYDEIRERWPVFNIPDDYIGVFEPKAGYLNSELAITLFIEKAGEAGAEWLFNNPVTSLQAKGDVTLVSTEKGDFTARHVVITAGTWVKHLVPNLPVQPVRKVFSWHQADGRFSENNKFPAFTIETRDEGHFYGFPAGNEGLKIGKHEGGQIINTPEERVPFGAVAEDGTEVISFLKNFMPGVGVCLEGKSCTYDLTPDEDFIIDTLPNLPGTMIVTGLSGHGFKFASVLGEILSDFVDGKAPSYDLSPFKLSRPSLANERSND